MALSKIYLDLARDIITSAFLIGFLIVFAIDAIQIWKRSKPPENDARTYIWTAVSVLVGTVAASALGVPFPGGQETLLNISKDTWKALYAIAYSIAGLIAVLTWFVRTEWTSVLVKNLAATFLAIAGPAISVFLLK